MKIQPGKKEVQPQVEKTTGSLHGKIVQAGKAVFAVAVPAIASYAVEARTAALETNAAWIMRDWLGWSLASIAGTTWHAALLNMPLIAAGGVAAVGAAYVGYRTLFSRSAEEVVEAKPAVPLTSAQKEEIISAQREEIAITVRQTIGEDPEKVRELLPKLVNADVTAEVIAKEIRSLIDEKVFDNSAKNNALFDGMAAYMRQIEGSKLRKDLKDQPEMADIFRHVREINEKLEGIKHASKDTKNEWREARKDFDKIAEDVFIKPIVPLIGKAKEAVDGILRDIRNTPETVKDIFNSIGSTAADLAIVQGIKQLIDEGVFDNSAKNNALFDGMAAYMGQIDKKKLEKDLKEPAMVRILKEVREINDKLEGIKHASKDTKNEWRGARKDFDAVVKDAVKEGLFPVRQIPPAVQPPSIPPAVQTPSMAPVGKPLVPDFKKETFDRLEAKRKGVPLAGELPKGPAVLPGTVDVLVGIINNARDVTRIISNLGVFNTAKDLSTFKAILTLIDCGVFEADDEWQALHDGMVAFLIKIDKDDLKQDYKDGKPVFEIADYVEAIDMGINDKKSGEADPVYTDAYNRFFEILQGLKKELKPAARAPITKSEIAKDVLMSLWQAYDTVDVKGQVQIINAAWNLFGIHPIQIRDFMKNLMDQRKLPDQQHRQAFVGGLVDYIEVINNTTRAPLQFLIDSIIIHDNNPANKNASIFRTFMDMIDRVSDNVKQFVYGRIVHLFDFAKADGNDPEKFWHEQMAGFNPIFTENLDKLTLLQEPSKGKEKKTDVVVEQLKAELAVKTSAVLVEDYKTASTTKASPALLEQKVLILQELMGRLNDGDEDNATMAFSSIDVLLREKGPTFSSNEWQAIVDGFLDYAEKQDVLNADWTAKESSIPQNRVWQLITALAEKNIRNVKDVDLTKLNEFLNDLSAKIPENSGLSKLYIEKILGGKPATSAQPAPTRGPTVKPVDTTGTSATISTTSTTTPTSTVPSTPTTISTTSTTSTTTTGTVTPSKTSGTSTVPSTPTSISTTSTTSTTTTGTVTPSKTSDATTVLSESKKIDDLIAQMKSGNVVAVMDAMNQLGEAYRGIAYVDNKVKVINALMNQFRHGVGFFSADAAKIISSMITNDEITSQQEWNAILINFNNYLHDEMMKNTDFRYSSRTTTAGGSKSEIISLMMAALKPKKSTIETYGADIGIGQLRDSLKEFEKRIPESDKSDRANELRSSIETFTKASAPIAVPSIAQADSKRVGELLTQIMPQNMVRQDRLNALRELGVSYPKVSSDDKVRIINAVMGLFDDEMDIVPLTAAIVINTMMQNNEIQSSLEWTAILNNFSKYLENKLSDPGFKYVTTYGRSHQYLIIENVMLFLGSRVSVIKQSGAKIDQLKGVLANLKDRIPETDKSPSAENLRNYIDYFK